MGEPVVSRRSRGASVTELAEGLRRGEIDPVEQTIAALERIERLDPVVNAMVLVDPDGALAAARQAARRWERGAPLSPVDGIPTTIKDILLTKNWPTLRGSTLIDAHGPWPEDAPAVARLRAAGCVLLGKNTTPEFAWKGVTDSLRHGATGNPWGAELTSGGSSGGAATAVGLGMGAWSVGTDGGGSVRIPASFTGTVALKPTYGRIPLYPASPYGTLAHAGPMTRTVADAALMLDVIGRPDARDWSCLPEPTGSHREALEGGVAGLRIAVSTGLGWDVPNDPEVSAAVLRAAEVFASAGARVSEVDPRIDDPVDAFHVLWFCGAAKVVEAYGPDALDRVDVGLAQAIREHGEARTASDYLDATAVRMELGRRMGLFHNDYDLLLTPTMPVAAFGIGRPAPQGWPRLWTSWTPYTYPFNMTQQPALSLPCGFTLDQRPIGLQIVGARHDDARVLRAGHTYQQLTDFHTSLPTLLTDLEEASHFEE